MNYTYIYAIRFITQPAVTCSKSTRETPEQYVQYAQSSK